MILYDAVNLPVTVAALATVAIVATGMTGATLASQVAFMTAFAF